MLTIGLLIALQAATPSVAPPGDTPAPKNELKLNFTMDQAFFDSADRNHDDVLTLAEFAGELRSHVDRAIAAHPEAEARITPAKRAESVEQMAGAMFRMLDANSDQMLTYAEINKGATRQQSSVT